MRTIIISGGEAVLVDEDDFAALALHKWATARNKWGLYAVRGVYVRETRSYRTILMHREIMGLDYGDKRQVDHADRNGLNNQRANLRIATPSQQAANQKKQSNFRGRACSSVYRGVIWDRRRNYWRSEIKIDGRHHYLGSFQSEREAAMAYDKKLLATHGAFALLNFPVTP